MPRHGQKVATADKALAGVPVARVGREVGSVEGLSGKQVDGTW